MCVRDGRFYVRRRIPKCARLVAGPAEIWRSLHTDSFQTALRRFPLVASHIETLITTMAMDAGLSVDPILLPMPVPVDFAYDATRAVSREAVAHISLEKNDAAGGPPPVASPTFGDAYDRYINDPTQTWSERTRECYETCRRVAVSIIGHDTLIAAISRTHIRDFINVLKLLPRNAAKRFPKLSMREASDLMRLESHPNLISSANANTYLTSLSTFINWAVNEELMHRNPARGLRLPDEVAKRDKRHPFSADQLEAIFQAPLYRGCLNGERGYALPGLDRPRNARFWVPLLALHTGMRLNEICQLDVADIECVDGIICISIRGESLVGSVDKRLKTSASRRVVPVHRELLGFGFLAFVEDQRRAGHRKLFHEVEPGPKGTRSVAFSKWFTQFLRRSGASRDRTCFHSFRHSFRDELRVARIDHDVAMALGGWTSGLSGRNEVSQNYGYGHPVQLLRDAIDRLKFSHIDLSHLRL
jgi:integrase